MARSISLLCPYDSLLNRTPVTSTQLPLLCCAQQSFPIGWLNSEANAIIGPGLAPLPISESCMEVYLGAYRFDLGPGVAGTLIHFRRAPAVVCSDLGSGFSDREDIV